MAINKTILNFHITDVGLTGIEGDLFTYVALFVSS